MPQAPGPVIETARLILRPTALEDFAGWAELMSDPVASKFIGGPMAPPAAWRGLTSMAGAWTLQGFGMFSVIEKATGQWIGRLGPWYPHAWPGTEVGWSLLQSAWGQGYATEGASAAMNWVVDHLGWTEIIHCIDPANTPSQAVARRLGSQILRRTHLPAPFEHIEVDIWGQSRDGRPAAIS